MRALGTFRFKKQSLFYFFASWKVLERLQEVDWLPSLND